MNAPQRFEAESQGETSYEFSEDWLSGHIPTWNRVFDVIHPEKLLEIGSYEGRSTCYLIETCTRTKPTGMYCVDTWLGGFEHDPQEMDAVELRFDRNVTKALRKIEHPCDFHKMKGPSSIVLAGLISSGHAQTFDFVYIDGSHQATDVLTDAVMAFQLLRVGGAMIFDDYLWHSEPHGQEDAFNLPKPAIDAFLNIYRRKVQIHPYLPLCQLYARKTSL